VVAGVDQSVERPFFTTATVTTAATLSLPLATDTLVYTVPATDTAVYAVTASVDFPQFAAAQTFVMTVAGVPAMVSAVVTPGTSIVITYNENVNCPTTFAAGTWTYDSAVGVPGGTATACSGTGSNTLTLAGDFNAATATASLTYSAATSANAVTATAGEGGAAEANGDAISGAKI
jgi:hypothetical protein